MYYSGIHLHKKTSFITTIDGSSKVVFGRNFTNREADRGIQKRRIVNDVARRLGVSTSAI